MKLSEALARYPGGLPIVEVVCGSCEARLGRYRVTDFDGDWVELDWGRKRMQFRTKDRRLQAVRVLRPALDPDHPHRWFRYEWPHKTRAQRHHNPQHRADRFGGVEAEIRKDCIRARV